MLHHWLGDLPTDTQRRVERGKRILKHRTDPRSEQAPTQRWRERSQVLTLEQDRAADLGFWAQKVQNGTGHAALAGPGLADDSERASGAQRKTDVAHSSDLTRARAVADRQIADVEQRLRAVHPRPPSFGSSTSRK